MFNKSERQAQCIQVSSFRDTEQAEYTSLSHYRRLPRKSVGMAMAERFLAQGIKEKSSLEFKTLKQAAVRISWVHTPILLVGSDVTQAKLKSEIIRFATLLKIPIANTLRAKGIVPETHPLALGTVASPKNYNCYGFDWADLVITIGCDALECAPQYWNPDGDIPILHISNFSAEVNCYYQPNLELVGNLSDLLTSLLIHIKR